MLKSTQKTDTKTYPFEYSYNALGGLETEKYPSGRVVGTCYDEVGRAIAVKNGGVSSVDVYAQVADGPDPLNPGVTVPGYHPSGQIGRMVHESGKLTVRADYNQLVQPIGMSLYKTPAGGTVETLMRLTPGYGVDGSNNGNVRSQGVSVSSFTVTQNYEYDKFNRLKVAQEGSTWRQEFGYDRWGNRWLVPTGMVGFSVPAGVPASPEAYVAATNRVKYIEDSDSNPSNDKTDAAGNQSMNGSWRNRYDVENRIVRVETPGTAPAMVAGSYAYDGEGRRVKKTVGAATTVFVYDAQGQMVQEGPADSPAGAMERSYLFQDHLGSTRMRVDQNGVRKGWWDYAPFGEVVTGVLGGRSGVAGGAYEGDQPSMMFTGKERDAETGLDYFNARYLGTSLGRFTSPDAPFADQDPVDPQSWNLYTYVRNNPVRFIDPSGQKCINGKDAKGDACFEAEAVARREDIDSRTLGLYWLLGLLNPIETFTGNDQFTRELDRGSFMNHVRWRIQRRFNNCEIPKMKGQIPRNLSAEGPGNIGIVGTVGTFAHDSLIFATGGLAGNLAQASQGSFQVDYDITSIDQDNGIATVNFGFENTMGLSSFTKVPGTKFSALSNVQEGFGKNVKVKAAWSGTVKFNDRGCPPK